MKTAVVGILLILLFSVTGCSQNKPSNIEVIQPLVIHIIGLEIVVDDEEKVVIVQDILDSIDWKPMEATWSTEPDVEFYLNPRGVESKLANWYQIWFNESGAEIFQTGDKLYGKVSQSNAKLLQVILNSGVEK